MTELLSITLQRYKTSDHGTFGILLGPDFWCFTIELPWRDNQRSISCVPAGTYICERVRSPRFGEVYLLKDVPGRSGILVHSGNLAGDTSKGLLTHSHGCILPGSRTGKLQGQRAVLASKPAFRKIMTRTDNRRLELEIRDGLVS